MVSTDDQVTRCSFQAEEQILGLVTQMEQVWMTFLNCDYIFLVRDLGM